jgi:hypothetical protein
VTGPGVRPGRTDAALPPPPRRSNQPAFTTFPTCTTVTARAIPATWCGKLRPPGRTLPQLRPCTCISRLQAKTCYPVPDVIGMNLSNAAAALKQAGFTDIPYVYKCYGSTDINAVVRQSPAAGTSHSHLQPVYLELQATNC